MLLLVMKLKREILFNHSHVDCLNAQVLQRRQSCQGATGDGRDVVAFDFTEE